MRAASGLSISTLGIGLDARMEHCGQFALQRSVI
jgi:hypothetical protein